jgi:hypothetical protein
MCNVYVIVWNGCDCSDFGSKTKKKTFLKELKIWQRKNNFESNRDVSKKRKKIINHSKKKMFA